MRTRFDAAIRGLWLAALLPLAPSVHAAPGAGALRAECEYGVTLAMSGETARAESVFVSLLSHAPGDARALTNLGNVHLVRGDADVALSFYNWALKNDSTDAGIRLNRATAWMLLGDDDRAREEAARGVRQAGGLRAASALLGLPAPTPAEGANRGSRGAMVTKDEVRALLNAAVSGIPADTSRTRVRTDDPKGKRKSPTWRSAGARAAGESDIVTVLYWKR
jgi:tetratricopeptide (TPR) repeat protein